MNIQAAKRKFYSNNKRAKAYGIEPKLKLNEWLEIIIRANGKCAYCKRDIGDKFLTMDHVIPLCKGGEHSASNIVMACHPCNVSKRHLDVAVFLDKPVYPFIERQPEHYTIWDLALINRTTDSSISRFSRLGQIVPVGVCCRDRKTLLFGQDSFDFFKKRRDSMDDYLLQYGITYEKYIAQVEEEFRARSSKTDPS